MLLLPPRVTLLVTDSQTWQIWNKKIVSCIVVPLAPYLAGKQWCNGRDHVGRYCKWIIISWFVFFLGKFFNFYEQCVLCYVLIMFRLIWSYGVPKKHFFGHAGWQANLRWSVRPETRRSDMAALLWVLAPGPHNIRLGSPYNKSKIQNCHTKPIVCSFESSWRGNQIWGINNTLQTKFREKIQTKTKWPW